MNINEIKTLDDFSEYLKWKSDHDEEIASLHQLKDGEDDEFIAAQFMGSSLAYFDAYEIFLNLREELRRELQQELQTITVKLL